MSREKITITSPGPILPGTISTAHAKCGKPTCRCRQDPRYMHGPYYRWTGWIDGKATTKTVSGAAAESAGLKNVHPHTLRHSCGFYLADKGTDLRTMQDYLGHRDPRHTVHYTRVSGRRFEGLWK